MRQLLAVASHPKIRSPIVGIDERRRCSRAIPTEKNPPV